MGIELYPHRSGIGGMEPVALIGQNICVKYATTDHFRRVTWFEPLAPFQFLDIGALAAATTSPRTPAPNLQLWDNELAQIRWYPLDTVQVRLYVPNADGRMQLRNLQVPIDPTIVTRDPCLHLTEIYVWEDRNPAFEAINYTAVALTQVRLIGMGFRFVTVALEQTDIQRIKQGSLQCTYVVASGHAGVA